MDLSWFSLPGHIQLSLASGYAAYYYAYVGSRSHHKTIDVALITLLFGMVATAVFLVLSPYTGTIIAGILAFSASVFAGAAWRWRGKDFLESDLKRHDFSWGNDDPSALHTLTSKTRFHFTQIAIQLVDETWLRCDDAELFSRSPHGPFTIGPSGDIALYLTQIDDPNGKETILKTVKSEHLGDRITYVPANQIRRITLRMREANRPSKGVA
jgi:hypothetical protein